MQIGSRFAVAAYATSTTRVTSAFSSYPSIPFITFRPALYSPLRLTIPSQLNMSASTTSDTDPELDIASNISSVKQRIADAMASNDRLEGSVRLVAVSKTKPLELLQTAYEVRSRYYFPGLNVFRLIYPTLNVIY